MRWEPQHVEGRHNLGGGPERESDRLIVVRKRGNSRGAKGPDREHVSVDKEGVPLRKNWGRQGTLSTETGAGPKGEAESVGGVTGQFSACARGESFRESRMWENRTSGSMRGE